ncbi:MAG: ABC transporter permease, partial [Endomicrobiales bacterium]
MMTELFIAWRYLKARRKGFFSVLTTAIAVGGITLGVAALIITLAVMTGFHRDIREKILGIQPHIVVTKDQQFPIYRYEALRQRIAQTPGVLATAPFVYGQIILRNNQNVVGALIKGIDLDAEDRLVHVRKTFLGTGQTVLAKKDIIIGEELARTLGVRIGDTVLLMSPGQFTAIPKMYQFSVVRIFHSGMYEYDASLAFINLSDAQELFGLADGVSGIGVSVDDSDHADRVAQRLQESFPYPYVARSWDRMNKNLFAALKLEKIMMFIILTLIILVAAFNIVSNLLM